ncbi:MAG: YggU family protein [Candidatus Koribacter versatilis]|uniref:UPF0235 protein HYX28_10665 n=1 Tax=Candidatus Korobacter versatilis TaxID=658062 RepID=A0A932EPV5_9BACT|nr:YggU family protein [Candidatus Koribacter versatilis]
MILIKATAGGVSLRVKVRPRAKRDAITGIHDEALKLSLTAPPIEGRANDAVIDFFAQLLRLPRSSITIAAGHTSRNKVVRISGISASTLEQRLVELLANSQ